MLLWGAEANITAGSMPVNRPLAAPCLPAHPVTAAVCQYHSTPWPQDKSSTLAVPSADPEAEEKRRREAEEARLAEMRAHGHAVTPEAFAEVRGRVVRSGGLARATHLSTAEGRQAASTAAFPPCVHVAGGVHCNLRIRLPSPARSGRRGLMRRWRCSGPSWRARRARTRSG